MEDLPAVTKNTVLVTGKLTHYWKLYFVASGCGSVGRAIASDTRDPQFKSINWLSFIYQLYIRKEENEEKKARNGPSLKKLY